MRLSHIFPGGLLAVALAAIAFWQAALQGENLPARVLDSGRIVLSSGFIAYDSRDPLRSGDDDNLLDGDPETPAVLRHPSGHPEGTTWFLIDLALSHWPALRGGAPRPRRPVSLRIWNGVCAQCPPEVFRRYSRIKRARLQLLQRRANRPDVEYIIPQAEPFGEYEINLPDRPGPVTIEFTGAELAPASPGWPDQIQYLIAKLIIIEIYPGSEFSDRVAVGETLYTDADEQGAAFAWR